MSILLSTMLISSDRNQGVGPDSSRAKFRGVGITRSELLSALKVLVHETVFNMD